MSALLHDILAWLEDIESQRLQIVGALGTAIKKGEFSQQSAAAQATLGRWENLQQHLAALAQDAAHMADLAPPPFATQPGDDASPINDPTRYDRSLFD